MENKIEVIGEQSSQLAKVSSTTSTEQNSQISFLFEGFSSANIPSRFPEISAAINLAQANKCEYFDSISSYDTEQIGTLLKGKSENERKAILLGIYLDFSSEGSSADIIKNLLIKPYQAFFGEVPKWLNNLNPFTINFFAAEVMTSNIFNNDPEKFKLYHRSVREEAAIISDEISARRFIAYVSERPKLKIIYGLIGSAHLNMLDNIGKVITKEGNYKLIKVQLNDNAINVHLFGGTHGEMEHYELLAKRAEQDGLIVPPPPVVTEDKSMEELLKLLLSSRSFSLQSSCDQLFDIDEEEKIEQQIENKPINELVNQFDYWMKNYNHNKKLTHNEELINWLTADNGGKYVKTYKHFCELAEKLNNKGYLTSVPPTESEFNKAMKKYDKKEQSYSKKFM